ncbi:MAG: hypothetical protein JO197_13185 [Acidobacteria bacterium]|nr:hypothetical protein [Acidobacteriota bacterium]MBV9477648.1 hypothetical protein [Acidobacteriota bacterium]
MRLFASAAGEVVLPAPHLVLVDRADGGHLIVNPPRPVWERSELTRDELVAWSLLVAAAGRAMLDALPALAGGCLNYWEAGNWSLHDDAEPRGAKSVVESRRVHLHLLGRSRTAADPAWQWGEAPRFPTFHDRLAWAAPHQQLNAHECAAIAQRLERIAREQYGLEGTRCVLA